MAVFTTLTRADIRALLHDNNVDELVAFHGVEDGTENTTYLVEGQQDRYVISIFERWVETQDIPFFVDLLTGLSGQGVPCPRPIQGGDGRAITQVADRPALVTSFLPGRPVDDPGPEECAACGAVLADIHRFTRTFEGHRPNMLSLPSWHGLYEQCGPGLREIGDGLDGELQRALAMVSRNWPEGLPAGVIHGDLFPDNMFFSQEGDRGKATGVIDFFFACNDALAYDLAVALASWTFDVSGQFQPARAAAMLAGYHARKPLSEAEKQGLATLTQGAALRFTLTRAYDWLNPKTDAKIRPKDPMQMLPRLTLFLDSPEVIADALP